MLDETRGLFADNNKTIQLTYKQTRLLYYLIRNKHRLVRYEELAKFVGWNIYDNYTLNSLVVLIYKTRLKLKGILNIKNVMNIGYIIEYVGGKQ